MRPLVEMNDCELTTHVERLRRDVNDFCGRAAQVASTLKREGHVHFNDPLYQRLSSIRDFLREQLGQAEGELERRMQAGGTRPATTLGAAVLGLCLPWRRARATK